MTRFRLYPEGRGRGRMTARLFIFDEQEELQEWVEGLDGDRHLAPDLYAVATREEPSGRLTVAFWRDKMTVQMIAHEALHLTVFIAEKRGWLRKLQLDAGYWGSDKEELMADVTGRTVAQILRRARG